MGSQTHISPVYTRSGEILSPAKMPPREMTELSIYPDLKTTDLLWDCYLSLGELKEAFRLFDDLGRGYITVERFREILREIDNTISEEELDGIISEIDTDSSDTIDFAE